MTLVEYLKSLMGPSIEYAEGSWTPNLWDTSNSSGKGQQYYQQDGEYTRVGRLVFFSCRLRVSDFGSLTPSHGIRIGPLPFKSATKVTHQGVFVGEGSKLSLTKVGAITGTITAGHNHILLQKYSETSGAVGFTIGEISRFSQLSVSGFYTVA